MSGQTLKALLELVKKGEVEALRGEIERLGVDVVDLYDENNKHNGVFYATLIRDEAQCMRMVDYLVANGVDLSVVDSLSQTALFYAARDNKP